MEIINDINKLNYYIEKYRIDNLFENSMKEYMFLCKWDKGEYICRESEDLNYMYFIVKGKAKVYKNLENGRSFLLCFYDPFKIIGDIEFIKRSRADCSVETINETLGIGINIDIVRDKLLSDSKFLLNICEYLSEKLSTNSTNSSINLLYPLENRLASYILAFITAEEIDASYIEFEFEGNYSEIAELLGTSYRHLNRTINKMCSENILEKKDKKYIIKNIKKLKMLCGDLYK